jgi:hypothetical protein
MPRSAAAVPDHAEGTRASALCLAALAAAFADRVSPQGEARRWALAVLAWLALTWNGDRLVQHMEARRTTAYPQLHGDPTVDRALIAERAIATLRQAQLPPRTELVLLSRERVALLGRILRGSGEEPPPPEEAYPESNVRAALYDGIAVRALFPAVDSVVFNRDVGPGTTRRRYGIYASTGEAYEAAALDSLLRSPWIDR